MLDLRRIGLGLVVAVGIAGFAAFTLRAADTSAPPVTSPATAPLFPVVIRHPAGPPRVFTGAVDHAGQPATVACSTCHTTRVPNFSNHSTADLDLFHQGLQFAHGNADAVGTGQTASTNTCLTCHNPNDYDSLRLANGTRVEFTEVMTLCSQCHGPQYRDYQHGAHGGMNGYWDLSRGGRVRNNCLDCHDPHVPKYQRALPMQPPHDRFLTPTAHEGTTHE